MMIIVIGALSYVRIYKKEAIVAHIKKRKRGQRAQIKKRGPRAQIKKEREKEREKERRDNATIFFHTCAS